MKGVKARGIYGLFFVKITGVLSLVFCQVTDARSLKMRLPEAVGAVGRSRAA